MNLKNIIDEKKCTGCMACKNKNEQIRLQSSSGGIFTIIAEWILKQNGIVFGAKIEKNMTVNHSYIKTPEELVDFRGSKYVQSKIGDTYKKAKEFLLQNKKVLFTGTPCQIEGLLAYLGKEIFENIKQDIEFINADINDIKKYNPCICISATENEQRDEFFYDLDNKAFNKVLEKYL